MPNCWGFIDGTVLPICRPQKHQRELFSGHKRHHCLKFQSVYCPYDIIVHLDGPFVRRCHDAGIFQESGLLEQLIGKVNANGDAMYLYGDPAYPLLTQLIVPYRGANVSPEQLEFNRCMTPLSICVEWGFGEVLKTFAFLDHKKNRKLVSATYRFTVSSCSCANKL